MRHYMYGRTAALVSVLSLALTGALACCWRTDWVPSKAELEDMSSRNIEAQWTPLPEISLEWVTLREAEERMPFQILQPTYLPEGVTLSGIRATKAGENIQVVRLVYSNGLSVTQSPQAYLQVDGLPDVVRASRHEKLDVNGASAIGYETEPPEYGTEPIPADLTWGCGGGGCRVTGDLPLEELLRIAESMQ
jgi:hypothetical protein